LKINESLEEDESEPELFSSQPTEKDESQDLGFKPRGKYLAWPRLIDSIGLCYLAALIMRLPICVSDFHRYASCSPLVTKELTFVAVWSSGKIFPISEW
jgi:RNA polymerase I-specific transcription initiation factor RRN7